ncbi:MAG: hypothetical protein B7X99_02460, partial [Rhizobiales bacterium 17-65-6]
MARLASHRAIFYDAGSTAPVQTGALLCLRRISVFGPASCGRTPTVANVVVVGSQWGDEGKGK